MAIPRMMTTFLLLHHAQTILDMAAEGKEETTVVSMMEGITLHEVTSDLCELLLMELGIDRPEILITDVNMADLTMPIDEVMEMQEVNVMYLEKELSMDVLTEEEWLLCVNDLVQPVAMTME